MPAGDGTTRVVSGLPCEEWGAQLADEIRIGVDLWTIFACHECAPEARETAPLSCTVFPLPRADGSGTLEEPLRKRRESRPVATTERFIRARGDEARVSSVRRTQP